MAPSSRTDPARPQKSRATRAFVWVGIVALVLAAALSGTWYVLAGRLDEAVRAAIATAGGQGVRIACANQEVFGYPFRLGLRCESLGIDAPEKNVAASGGALRTAAQIYRPTQVVAELDGPLSVVAQGVPPLVIDWTLGQASAHFWTEGLDRFALSMDAPSLGVAPDGGATQPVLRSDHLEVHARRREGHLDLAVTDRGVRAEQPAFAGLPAFDLSADMTVDGAADWLSGRRPGRTVGEALAGRSGTIRTLGIAIAGDPTAGSATVSGPFAVSAERIVSGEFELVVTEPGRIADLVARLAPDLAGIAGSVASGIGFAGKTENGRTTIRIAVRDGNASLGVIPLGAIPPLE